MPEDRTPLTSYPLVRIDLTGAALALQELEGVADAFGAIGNHMRTAEDAIRAELRKLEVDAAVEAITAPAHHADPEPVMLPDPVADDAGPGPDIDEGWSGTPTEVTLASEQVTMGKTPTRFEDALHDVGLARYGIPAGKTSGVDLTYLTLAVGLIAGQDGLLQGLVMAAAACMDWLEDLGVQEPAIVLKREHELQLEKHPGATLDADGPTDEQRLASVVQKLGQVAHALTYDPDLCGYRQDFKLAELGALCVAWLARFDRLRFTEDGEVDL